MMEKINILKAYKNDPLVIFIENIVSEVPYAKN